MNVHLLQALAHTEVRLRMRRLSTLVALLVVVVLSWAGLEDPDSGRSLIVVSHARVLYTSSALALGSAMMASMLFSLGAFYLVRGRIAEDIRSGAGSVIGATPVGNGLFLAGRWLGGVAYLGLLALAVMATIMACHLLRGEGPVQPLIYLSTYCLILLPGIFLAASCAILFDSWAPLMGKGGDILYFFLWVAQMTVTAVLLEHRALDSAWAAADFMGLAATMATLAGHFDPKHTSLGGGATFDAALAPLLLPELPFSARVVAMRCASAVLALAPLLAAVPLFHRFSPDKVKLASSRRRRSPLAMLDGLLRPLSRLATPLFALAARLPRWCGQALADVALTLAASPSAIAALLAAVAAAAVVDARQLGFVLMACVAAWGILVSDISTRDYQAGVEDMTGAVEGGAARRYLRQFGAALILGWMFMGVVALRFAAHAPARAGACAAGIFALAALASLLGRCSRTPRTFLALFLFGLYVASQAVRAPMLDAVGFNGSATVQSALVYLAVGAAALAGGWLWNRAA